MTSDENQDALGKIGWKAVQRRLAADQYYKADKPSNAVRYERLIKMKKAGDELENAIEAYLKGQK